MLSTSCGSVRMAQLEMPNKTMKSASGHKKDGEVARYTEAASQERLADGANKRPSSWEISNPKSELDTKMPKAFNYHQN